MIHLFRFNYNKETTLLSHCITDSNTLFKAFIIIPSLPAATYTHISIPHPARGVWLSRATSQTWEHATAENVFPDPSGSLNCRRGNRQLCGPNRPPHLVPGERWPLFHRPPGLWWVSRPPPFPTGVPTSASTEKTAFLKQNSVYRRATR